LKRFGVAFRWALWHNTQSLPAAQEISAVWETLKQMFRTSPDRLCLIFGVALVALSFISIICIDKWGLALSASPNWYFFFTGLCLLLGWALQTFLLPLLTAPGRLHRRLRKTAHGLRIDLPRDHWIEVIRGSIEEQSEADQHTGVVLPANTSFDDECISDNHTALGAFATRHFSKTPAEIQALVRTELARTVGKDAADIPDLWPLGHTVFLDRPFGTHHRLIIVAVTRISPADGIRGSTEGVVAAVRGTFREAATRRLSRIFMPVVGSGHGGLDLSMALSLILIEAISCMLHEGYHQVKGLTVVVHDPEGAHWGDVKRTVQAVAAIP
jgi:O-acetyl-ADP-ribose deacetylase (regulator of RNase III)